MLDAIITFDQQLFLALNNLGSAAYDGLWLFITKQFNWIPVFAIFAYLVFKHLGWRHALLILLMLGFLIAVTDQTTNLFKYGFARLRPCNEPALKGLVRVVLQRDSFSFISGHAANSMASAMFLFFLLRKHVKFMGLIFLWPLIFAYSRIYLGLHYPLDILCGFLWGTGMAFLMWEVYLHFHKRLFPQEREFLDDAA